MSVTDVVSSTYDSDLIPNLLVFGVSNLHASLLSYALTNPLSPAK